MSVDQRWRWGLPPTSLSVVGRHNSIKGGKPCGQCRRSDAPCTEGTHKGDPKGARAMCRGNSIPAPTASTPPSRSNKVVSRVYQAAAAVNFTEAHPWKRAGGKSGNQASCQRLWCAWNTSPIHWTPSCP